jgi:dipeptidase E
VRLYLWSFRMGGNPEHLAVPVGEDGRRAVIIASALDDASAHVRRAGAERELAALVGLGVDAVELDLREYFGQEQRLRRDLAWVSPAWLRGGNVFMLRYTLRLGGVSRLSGGIGRATNRPHARTIAARGGAPVRPALRMLRARRV